MIAFPIAHSTQLDRLVEKKWPDSIVQGCADVIRCVPGKSADTFHAQCDPFHAQCNAFETGLEIAAALMKSKVKTPKLYEFWVDDDGDFYYVYFVGNVQTIRKRLEGLEDREEEEWTSAEKKRRGNRKRGLAGFVRLK